MKFSMFYLLTTLFRIFLLSFNLLLKSYQKLKKIFFLIFLECEIYLVIIMKHQKHTCHIYIYSMGAWPTPSKYTFASKESTDTP